MVKLGDENAIKASKLYYSTVICLLKKKKTLYVSMIEYSLFIIRFQFQMSFTLASIEMLDNNEAHSFTNYSTPKITLNSNSNHTHLFSHPN